MIRPPMKAEYLQRAFPTRCIDSQPYQRLSHSSECLNHPVDLMPQCLELVRRADFRSSIAAIYVMGVIDTHVRRKGRYVCWQRVVTRTWP